jgi:hypothetical protein
VEQLCTDPATANNNKSFMETGTKLSRALEAFEGKEEFGSEILTSSIADILQKYDQYLNVNHTVFEQITAHHNNIVGEKWSDVAADGSSLAVYSEAANAMGSKVWVAECNKWFETFSIAYFRKGGARKHYLKSARNVESRSADDSLVKDLMAASALESCNTSHLPHAGSGDAGAVQELAAAAAVAARKIRVLDVGSCYNPIARSEQASLFDVIALDLFPVDASVLQCDFLNLVIGPEGSQPVVGANDSVSPFYSAATQASTDCIEGAEESTAQHRAKRQRHSDGTMACDNTVMVPTPLPAPAPAPAASRSQRLWRLPAAAYDVVTMSLVLSYLPTPAQRLHMVRQARNLLVSPPATAGATFTSCGSDGRGSDGAAALLGSAHVQRQPHCNGLLLIAEKQSIFKPPFKMGKAHSDASQNVGERESPQELAGASQERNSATHKDLNYWQNWVDAVCACGFELVKYHYFPSSDGRKSHLFAFGTAPLPSGRAVGADTVAGTAIGTEAEMWIKQDHERAAAPI